MGERERCGFIHIPANSETLITLVKKGFPKE
jgi:hypothetical protein